MSVINAYIIQSLELLLAVTIIVRTTLLLCYDSVTTESSGAEVSESTRYKIIFTWVKKYVYITLSLLFLREFLFNQIFQR